MSDHINGHKAGLVAERWAMRRIFPCARVPPLVALVLVVAMLLATGCGVTVGTPVTAPSAFERDGWSINYSKAWEAWMRGDRAEALGRFDVLMRTKWGKTRAANRDH